MSIHPVEAKDFHSALMTTNGGGIWDDLGWLCMADIQQVARDASKELKKLMLTGNTFFLDSLICMGIFHHKEKELLNMYLNYGWHME